MVARIEPLLRMACAFCGAPIGQPCQSKNGRKLYSIGSIHDARLSRRPVARYRRVKALAPSVANPARPLLLLRRQLLLRPAAPRSRLWPIETIYCHLKTRLRWFGVG